MKYFFACLEFALALFLAVWTVLGIQNGMPQLIVIPIGVIGVAALCSFGILILRDEP